MERTDPGEPATGSADRERIDPEEAFSLVGDETRVAILAALAGEAAPGPDGEGLTFSALRERVGADNTGQFTYHLDRLRGHFVAKDGDRYVLTAPGLAIASAIRSGTYTQRLARSAPATFDCPECDADTEVTYESGILALGCASGHTLFAKSVLASAVADRDLERAVLLVARNTAREVTLAREGYCPHCKGHTDSRVDPRHEDDAQHRFEATCGTCDLRFTGTLGMALARHPAVVSFLDDHGGDPRSLPVWDPTFTAPAAVRRAPGADPRYEFRVERGGEELVLVLDDSVEVVETRRSDR